MAKKGRRKRRFNTYFRQTSSAFKATRQTQVFSHLKRNLPWRMYKFSKERINKSKEYLSRFAGNQKKKYLEGKTYLKQK